MSPKCAPSVLSESLVAHCFMNTLWVFPGGSLKGLLTPRTHSTHQPVRGACQRQLPGHSQLHIQDETTLARTTYQKAPPAGWSFQSGVHICPIISDPNHRLAEDGDFARPFGTCSQSCSTCQCSARWQRPHVGQPAGSPSYKHLTAADPESPRTAHPAGAKRPIP